MKSVNNSTCSTIAPKVKKKPYNSWFTYFCNQWSFYLRSLNVILFLITRRLNLPHHPQIVRMFYNIKTLLTFMYQSIYINALLLTILIYGIKIYLLRVLSSMDLWRIWEDLWSYCQLLPTIVNYCQLLSTIANYCQLLLVMPTISNYCRLLATIANILLPTWELKLTGNIVWEIYTLFWLQ